jgi:hypothetical protein
MPGCCSRRERHSGRPVDARSVCPTAAVPGRFGSLAVSVTPPLIDLSGRQRLARVASQFT